MVTPEQPFQGILEPEPIPVIVRQIHGQENAVVMVILAVLAVLVVVELVVH
jgi:hypothetical protein